MFIEVLAVSWHLLGNYVDHVVVVWAADCGQLIIIINVL